MGVLEPIPHRYEGQLQLQTYYSKNHESEIQMPQVWTIQIYTKGCLEVEVPLVCAVPRERSGS